MHSKYSLWTLARRFYVGRKSGTRGGVTRKVVCTGIGFAVKEPCMVGTVWTNPCLLPKQAYKCYSHLVVGGGGEGGIFWHFWALSRHLPTENAECCMLSISGRG